MISDASGSARLILGDYYDVALRDFGLLVGALALWRLGRPPAGTRPSCADSPREALDRATHGPSSRKVDP